MSVQSIKLTQPSAIRAGLLICIAVLVALAVFRGALLELVERWSRQEEYSHGFLIPVVAGWLMWSRRDALLASVGQPAWTGPVLVLLAIGMHIIGELSAIFILSQVGFIVALIGIVLGIGGYSLLKVTFIPIIFLMFAIPLPYFIESILTLKLQLISSELGVFFIKLFQIPVYLEGNVIDLGYFKLQVVEACSGLRYLFPLLSLGFLAAYLFRAPLWQRALVFLSTIPITIAMNGFRIGMVGVTVDFWGTQVAEGALHFFEGWIIFVACSAMLAAEMFVLASLSGKAFFDVFRVPSVVASRPGGLGRGVASQMPLVAALVLLCAGGVAGSFISGRSEIVPERTRFATFPARIGQWQGRASLLDPETEQYLGVDDYILSDYTNNTDSKGVNLYVAYYSSQRKGVSPHSPIVCLPGGGWQITNFERSGYANLDVELPLNRVIIARETTKQLIYYWFDERGRKVANEWWAKWYLLADAILKNRTDGSLVRLTTVILPGESERDADERLRSFIREVVPSLSAYLPSGTKSELGSIPHNPKRGQS